MGETTVVADKIDNLTWPTPAADVQKADEVPLGVMLRELHLVSEEDEHQRATAEDAKWNATTLPSVQVITAGTLGIVKATRKWVIGAGGAGGVAAVVAAVVGFTRAIPEPLTVTLLGAAALVVSAAIVALGMTVSADLRARSSATAARFHSRAEITAAFLQATAGLPGRSGDSGMTRDFIAVHRANPNGIFVSTANHPGPTRVVAVSRTPNDDQLQVLLDDGCQIPVDRIVMFTTEQPKAQPGITSDGVWFSFAQHS